MSKITKNIDTFKNSLQEEIYSAWKELASREGIDPDLIGVDLTHPKEEGHGDYTTTIALKASKVLKKPSLEIAEKISSKFKVQSSKFKKLGIEKIEVKAPGFINFWLSEKFFISQMEEVLKEGDNLGENIIGHQKFEQFLKKLSNNIKLDHPTLKIMVEYAHPNTHKEFHIGHLRNITIAESLIRLLENLGIEVVRVNYQGDIGLHIAKALWALLQSSKFNPSTSLRTRVQNAKLKTTYEKVAFLGKAYVEGNRAYEDDEEAKKEIIELNRKIYEKDPEILPLWQETRQWSLDYFEEIYKRVGSFYDRYYFESEVCQLGKKVVEEYLKKGLFEKSEGAIIFPGEKYGLHNRVFVTNEGFPTYEAKDIGLGILQFKEYHPDLIVHVVGPEQTGYFEVVFEALGRILPESKGRELHFIYGWVQLKRGKMSSRAGNVVTARWLLDEAKKKAKEILNESQASTFKGSTFKGVYSKREVEEITEKVALAAVKYSMLKFAPRSDIFFDFEESVSLEGDSGPYLLYTYARCKSVLRRIKYQVSSIKYLKNENINSEELVLLRTIYKFPEVAFEAGGNLAPNLLCSYLFDLAQKYNLFYTFHSILTPKEKKEAVKELRLGLTAATAQILKNGLKLLGVPVLERM